MKLFLHNSVYTVPIESIGSFHYTAVMGKVVNMPQSLHKVEATIRKLAEDSGNVYFRDHASDRMYERGITQTQVVACLNRGVIVEGPMLESGGWKVTMELYCAGRTVGVAAKLVERVGSHILVVTVF